MSNDSVQRFRRECKVIARVDLVYMRPAIVAEAERLAEQMRARAPRGPTGNLRASIRVERGPKYNKNGQMIVRAGGPLTTRSYGGRAGYEREVKIGSGDTAGIARKTDGAGVSYDYAMATEFGTRKETAQPFFYTTYRGERKVIEQRIYDAIPSGRGVTPWDEFLAHFHSIGQDDVAV